MNKTVKNQILSRIYGRGRGWAFSPNDFILDFKRWEISNSLEDLTNEGKIRRIIRGIYDYPIYSEILGKHVSPDIEQVAYALSRKFAWRIQPSGETTLNYLGLSTQIMSKHIYFSDGASKKYNIDGQIIEFKHHAFKEASINNNNAILVIQAIKHTGEQNITKAFKEKLSVKFSIEQWQKIKKHAAKASGWIYKIISDISDSRKK